MTKINGIPQSGRYRSLGGRKLTSGGRGPGGVNGSGCLILLAVPALFILANFLLVASRTAG